VTIDFYVDFISPFGYLARHAVLEIAKRYQADVAFHPVDLPRIKRAAGNTGPTNREMPLKYAYLTEDVQRWAQRYRLPVVRHLPGPRTERFNKGIFLAQESGRAEEYVRHAWDCIWRDGLDPGVPESLTEVALRMRWDAAALLNYVDMPSTQERYEEACEAATARGVFGVPTFMIGDLMWWGNDRLDFLEEHLASCRRCELRAE
jgi:2-hydroxychromene-2-carboxylate isomerase